MAEVHSIKKNFAYNVFLTLSTYIASLIVFPYVSRVLGVDMMGRVYFVENVIRYFILFSMMGVTAVGIREIASCGDDREKRSEVFSNILALVLILTSVCVAAMVAMIYLVPKFGDYKRLMLIGTMYLMSSSLMIEWFYQGLENFRFVTIRALAVKLLYVLSVFIFVKSPEDYTLYFVLITLTLLANAAINLGYSRKFVRFSPGSVKLSKFAKPMFSLGLYVIMLSFFTTFSPVYLGFVRGDHEVGIYSTATKIYVIILGVVSAFTNVMMPRMSSLISENRMNEFREHIAESFRLLFAVSVPVAVGGIVMAPQIVQVLAGGQYADASLPMRIVMVAFLIVSISQICVIQVLIPMKKDKVVLISASAAAAVGVAANVCLVGRYGAVGSAISVVAAELTGNSINFAYAIRKGLLLFPVRAFIRQCVITVPYIVMCMVCGRCLHNVFVSLSTAVIGCFVLFVTTNRNIVKMVVR